MAFSSNRRATADDAYAIARRLIGSVARQVIAYAPCAVTVVRK
jgi:nucleotide-binding universal stress UspA family protein